jgi:hypothetical protein
MGPRAQVVIGDTEARIHAEIVAHASPRGLLVCAGSGAVSRSSPVTRAIVEQIGRRAEVTTLLFDLPTPAEQDDAYLRAHVPLLAQKLSAVTDWAMLAKVTAHLPIGYYTSGVGAAAAILAASSRPEVHVVVARDGRPDLAGAALDALRAPTLLLVTADDDELVATNRSARSRMRAMSELATISGGRDEPGAHEEIARRASAWIGRLIA